MHSIRRLGVLFFVSIVLFTACRTNVATQVTNKPDLGPAIVVTSVPATPLPLVPTAVTAATAASASPSPVANTLLPTIEPTIIPAEPRTTSATNEAALPPADDPTAISAAMTATPAQLRLAIPTGWLEDLQPFLSSLQDGEWQWQLVEATDPALELATGAADLAIVAGDEGITLGGQALVLAVPFMTDWHNTDSFHARQILANGHSLVQVMPWRSLRPPLRALRVNGFHPTDPAYPLTQPYALQTSPGNEAVAAFLAPHLTAFVSEDDAVEIAAVGDVNLDRALGAIIAGGRIEFPFLHVAPILQAADIAIANFESALGDIGEPAAKSYAFRSPPVAAESLANAGFDVVTLANNHGMDYGPEALLQGLDLLRAQQLATIGAGANADSARTPAILERQGLRLAFLGYVQVPVEGRPPYFDTETWTATADAPGLAWADPVLIAIDVAAARAQNDLVIVIIHSGLEYVPAPSPEQMSAAYAAIDAGASLVIGHHAHILQGVEFYHGGVIVYGLANFAFNIIGPPETAILSAWLDDEGVRAIEFTPAMLQESGQPRLANEAEAALIRQSIYAMSGGLVH